MTSGELAIARATRSASSVDARLAHLDPPDPRRALAVGDDLERELQQDRRRAGPPAAAARGAGRLQQHRVVGAHLAVDRDPLERAGDGASQLGLGVVDHGVGLHEAEHRREAGLDHPGALRLRGEGHPAGAHGAGLGTAIGGHDRLGEAPPARSREPAAASPIPASTSSIGSGTPITPVSATATERGSTPQRGGGRVAHRQRVAVALLAGGGVGVARVDDHGADPPARALVAADPDRRGGGGVPGQQHRRADLVGVADEEADVGLAAALQAAGRAAARKPGASSAGSSSSTSPAAATQRERKNLVVCCARRSPSVSSRPSIRFRFWIAWPEAPFQRLSIAAKTDRAALADDRRVDPAEVGVAHVANAGRRLDDLDERLVARSARRTGTQAPAPSALARST